VFASTSRVALQIVVGLTFGMVAAWLASAGLRRPRAGDAAQEAPATVEAEKLDPWKQAALKVEEDRGAPTGRQAEVEIPAQLKHYADRKRFLAIQVAEADEQQLPNPHDFAELAGLIRAGELRELQPLGDDYLLYGVGFGASDEPFTHYDAKTGQSVTLYAGEAELRQEYERIEASLTELGDEVKTHREELKKVDRRDKELLKNLRAQLAEREKAAAALRKRRELLKSNYGVARTRTRLAAEYLALAELAADFSGRAYDLDDAASRKELKVRLLSFLRPAAVQILEQVARSYREKFGRHLPVTSVVRTDEYQRQLSRTNANATRIETPPHTTGLAFDIYYRHMTAEEQAHVMTDLARLRDEGKIEALRELRDHFHVFAFNDGARPDDALIKRSRDDASERPREEKPDQRPAAAKAAAKAKAAKAAPRRAKTRAEQQRGKKTQTRPQRKAPRRGRR
jgi:DNA-binding transcriptional ArsR family regulator